MRRALKAGSSRVLGFVDDQGNKASWFLSGTAAELKDPGNSFKKLADAIVPQSRRESPLCFIYRHGKKGGLSS